jgi:DNA replication initiation complex subunit (GINS family)
MGVNMESKEINLTYETLFEILKREKDLADLQRLDSRFLQNFVIYLNEKKSMLTRKNSLFSNEEMKKTERQIDNARRIIKEIYERREKKIIHMALIKSRTKSNIIDTSSLLEHEKILFEQTEHALNRIRNCVIEKVLEAKNYDLSETNGPNHSTGGDLTIKKPLPEKEKDENIEKITTLVRFVHSVPKFVGKELEEYGPFQEEDIANLPTEIANVLIGKGRVEEIREGMS